MYFYPKYNNKWTDTPSRLENNTLFIFDQHMGNPISNEMIFFITKAALTLKKIWDEEQYQHCIFHLYIKV